MSIEKICDYCGYSCKCLGYVKAGSGSTICKCGHAKSSHNAELPRVLTAKQTLEDRILLDWLAAAMSNLSESLWCASWLSGLEFTLWRWVNNQSEATEEISEHYHPMIKDIGEISLKLDVWVAWDSNAELVAIPLCLWAHFFAEYKETSKGPANGLYGVPWVVSDLVKRPLLEV